jgi:hypothetical protein
MRDSKIVMLLWSLPIVLSLHVFEEFAFPGGLKKWINEYKPRRPKSNFYYLMVNATAIAGAVIIALTASDILGFRIYLYCVALMGGNAVSHLCGTVQAKQYCPGTYSGAFLLLPLLVISSWYLLREGKVDFTSAIICVGLGTFIGFYVFGLDIRKADIA